MKLLSLGMTLLVPLLVAIYTWNYARWAWKRELKFGAVGLFLLSISTVVVPAMIMWWIS